MFGPIRNPQLHLLLDHYLAVRGDRPMPSRRDIDPVQLGPVLPMIWMNEYERAAGTFRYRLAGERVNEIFGGSVAGRLLSDFVKGDRFEPVNRNFLKIIREQVAMLVTGPVYRCTDRIAIGERLALPLSSDGVTADGLIGATACDALVDFKRMSMSEQQATYVSVAELAEAVSRRAAGS